MARASPEGEPIRTTHIAPDAGWPMHSEVQQGPVRGRVAASAIPLWRTGLTGTKAPATRVVVVALFH